MVKAEGEENTQEGTEESSEPTAETVTDELGLTAKSAVLIDENSGKVLYELNKDTECDPASLTKLMTVYLAALTLDANTELTMSSTAFETYSHYSGVLWIQQGETLSVSDCMYAAMLVSANDPTAMLAEAAGISNDGMVDRMNTKAQELGMSHTHFDNVFGTNSETNYSSSYDMALLIQAARKNSTFKQVFGAESYTIEATNMQSSSRALGNDCDLLRTSKERYNASVTGGKIGSTEEGGYALGVSASKGDTNYIAVVLGEENEDAAYTDIGKLLDYGFENAQTLTVSVSDIGTKTVEVMNGRTHVADVEFYADSSFSLLLPAGIEASDVGYEIVVENEDATSAEEVSASLVFTLQGETIGTAELNKKITYIDNTVTASGEKKSEWIYGIISIAVFAFILFFKVFARFMDSLNPNR